MEKEWKISVLMAVYNGEKTVEKAIDSILNQSHRNLELVIVNDGSTDGTGEILSKMLAVDSRINIIHNVLNIGLTKSLNLGLRSCKGDFIARQDADDESLPERLQQQLSFLLLKKLDLVAASAVSSDGSRIPSSFYRRFTHSNTLLLGNYLVHGTYFGKRELFLEIEYDEEFKMAQDYGFILECLKRGKKIGVLSTVQYRLTTTGPRISNHSGDRQLDFAHKAQIKVRGSSIMFFNYMNSKKPKLIKFFIKLAYILKFYILDRSKEKITYS